MTTCITIFFKILKNKNMAKFCVIVKPHEYPNKPCRPIGKCYKEENDKFYHYQRERDVLTINYKSFLISSNSVGFLENHSKAIECSFKEFADVLNKTIFEMNIFNDEFKIK
jgi:hypothetical protein